MASLRNSRLAPVTARDGVNTRKQVNWATAAARPQETICRSDVIIGLGNPAVTNWGDMMTGMHDNRSKSVCMLTPYSDMRLYMDMADEPWKYSDEDLFAWLDLDEKLRGGVERSDVESYWQDREVRQKAEQARVEKRYRAETDARRVVFGFIAREAAKLGMKRWIDRDIKRIVKRFKGSATKIQSVVRGYQTRCNNPHLDCCMCLSHRVSPLKTAVGFMCRDCAVLGPYEDIVENDPWNWHRADSEDVTVHYQLCGGCDVPLRNGDYCSDACEIKDKSE